MAGQSDPQSRTSRDAKIRKSARITSPGGTMRWNEARLCRPSAVDGAHGGFGVAGAGGGAFGEGGVELGKFLRGQFDLDSGGVFLEVLDALGAGDGDDVVAPGEDPGEGELGGFA